MSNNPVVRTLLIALLLVLALGAVGYAGYQIGYRTALHQVAAPEGLKPATEGRGPMQPFRFGGREGDGFRTGLRQQFSGRMHFGWGMHAPMRGFGFFHPWPHPFVFLGFVILAIVLIWALTRSNQVQPAERSLRSRSRR